MHSIKILSNALDKRSDKTPEQMHSIKILSNALDKHSDTNPEHKPLQNPMNISHEFHGPQMLIGFAPKMKHTFCN